MSQLPIPLSIFLDTVRSVNPLIQCFSNYVSMDINANILLASGASPAMVHSIDECEQFTSFSSGLCINIGTLDKVWIESMKVSAKKAHDNNIPWVLDPVGCGATTLRTETSYTLASLYQPNAIRGNGGEIIALYNAALQHNNEQSNIDTTNTTKGVDSTIGSNKAITAGIYLSTKITKGIIVVSGETDYIICGANTKYNTTDKHIIMGVTSGTPLLQKITATGCSLSCLVAAFLSIASKVSSDKLSNPNETFIYAATAACAYFGAASDIATKANPNIGPGSLRVQLIDNLYSLHSKEINQISCQNIE